MICHGNEKGQWFDRDKKIAWQSEDFMADLGVVETLNNKPKIILIATGHAGQPNYFSTRLFHIHTKLAVILYSHKNAVFFIIWILIC